MLHSTKGSSYTSSVQLSIFVQVFCGVAAILFSNMVCSSSTIGYPNPSESFTTWRASNRVLLLLRTTPPAMSPLHAFSSGAGVSTTLLLIAAHIHTIYHFVTTSIACVLRTLTSHVSILLETMALKLLWAILGKSGLAFNSGPSAIVTPICPRPFRRYLQKFYCFIK